MRTLVTVIAQISSLLRLFNLAFPSRRSLILENFALRRQLAAYKRSGKRPRLRQSDRMILVWLSRCWVDWRSATVIVQPKTVVGWHRNAFRRYWRCKSRQRGRKPGRPRLTREVRKLVTEMKQSNPIWGAPRVHGELLKLGIEISERSISRLLQMIRKPPSQSWRVFLANHATDLVSLDFFTVPTIGFKILYVFVVLEHERRRVVHFNVTTNPTAFWTAQQMIEAFPYDTAPRYLLRDRDGIYSAEFRERVEGMGIKEVLTAQRSPWQNPFAERLIGSVRRECLDHVIVLNRRHLRRILTSYFDYYHRSRTHLGLDKEAPIEREVQGPERGKIVAFPEVGGLHHRYERRAA